MADRPLVSVVTGTWRRRDLLLGAIENARQQTYRPLEHVIVSDGPDPILREMLADEMGYPGVPIRFVELGRNWSTFLTDSISAVPFQVAQWLAAGDYMVWLADDERFLVPDALAAMVDRLTTEGTDFCYPKAEIWWKNDPSRRWVVGEPVPREGTVTHAMHRADILDIPGAGFRTHVGALSDWDQFQRWVAAGKRWSFLDRLTISHRADK